MPFKHDTELELAFKEWVDRMTKLHGKAFTSDNNGMFQAYAQGWADGLTAHAERAETVKR